MSKKRSPIWCYFDEIVLDAKHAKCKICKELVTRGSHIPSKRTTKALFDHLKKFHEKEHSIVFGLKEAKSKVSGNSSKNGSSGSGVSGNSSMNESGASGSGVSGKSSMNGRNGVSDKSSVNGSEECGETKISNLKSKAERKEAMSATIKDWIESKTKVAFHSPKGQAFHKSIFEMIIMDLQPFSIVNNLGFQRHHQIFLPTFEVRSKINVHKYGRVNVFLFTLDCHR